MFVSIVTSGHLSTSSITSHVRGAGELAITEYHFIRILMRIAYRFFSDISVSISNVFYYNNEWTNSDNFLVIEVLFFFCINPKILGEIGLEGSFYAYRLCGELQKVGYDRDDTLKALNYLLS